MATTEKAPADELTPEEVEAMRGERRARLAQLLDRGVVADKLSVEHLPNDMYGCWIRTTKEDMDRARALGFEVETEHVRHKGHGQGDNRDVVGDLVLMTTSRENYEDIEFVRQERKRRKFETQLTKARDEYVSRSAANPDVPVLDSSEIGVREGPLPGRPAGG